LRPGNIHNFESKVRAIQVILQKDNVHKWSWEVGRSFWTEVEIDHNPVDRAKAILHKLTEDKPDELAETAEYLPNLPADFPHMKSE